jgi:plasmid stability protein
MSSITVRNLDPGVKERLRIRAAKHGRSMEAEARQTALDVAETRPRTLDERIRERFEAFGGVDLDLMPRDAAREPPRFE